MENTIQEFQGQYRWLSNFWPAEVRLDGVWYPTVEHAYQAAKFDVPSIRAQFAMCARPGETKRLARRFLVRKDWNNVRLIIMEDLLRQKFARGSKLALMLRGTGTAVLIEGNRWGDTFWGVCRSEGENRLGQLLMRIRQDLQDADPR